MKTQALNFIVNTLNIGTLTTHDFCGTGTIIKEAVAFQDSGELQAAIINHIEFSDDPIEAFDLIADLGLIDEGDSDDIEIESGGFFIEMTFQTFRRGKGEIAY